MRGGGGRGGPCTGSKRISIENLRDDMDMSTTVVSKSARDYRVQHKGVPLP